MILSDNISKGDRYMDYRLSFYILLTAVIVYGACHTKIYVGYDEVKYNKATIGILLKGR